MANLAEVSVIGEVMRESIYEVAAFPTPNTTAVLPPYSPEIGGAVVNVAWYLGQLGRQVRLLSAASSKDCDTLRGVFKPFSITLSHLTELESESDHLITLLSGSDHQSLYVLAKLPETFVNSVLSDLGACRIVAMNGGRHPAVRTVYRTLAGRLNGQLVGFNPSYAIFAYPESDLLTILSQADVVIVNEQEFAHLCNVVPFNRLRKLLLRRGGVLIVTSGSKGATVYQTDTEISATPAIKRNGVFLGAGDALFSGFLHAYAQERSLSHALKLGMDVAATVVATGEIRAHLARS